MEFQKDSEGVPPFSSNLKLRTNNRIKCKRQQWLREHINMALGRPWIFW